MLCSTGRYLQSCTIVLLLLDGGELHVQLALIKYIVPGYLPRSGPDSLNQGRNAACQKAGKEGDSKSEHVGAYCILLNRSHAAALVYKSTIFLASRSKNYRSGLTDSTVSVAVPSSGRR